MLISLNFERLLIFGGFTACAKPIDFIYGAAAYLKLQLMDACSAL